MLPLFCAEARATQSLSVAWNANPDPRVSGYVVYYGNASHTYTSRVVVGTNTMITIAGLLEGQTNYVAVTSYTAANVEGTASSELTMMVPGVVHASPPAAGVPFNLNFPVAPGHSYEVQATTDLKTWATIWQSAVVSSNAMMNYQDAQSGSYLRRYYRLILH